ncbi:DUF2764 family protein [Candidatus Riflebacteria bacterium]
MAKYYFLVTALPELNMGEPPPFSGMEFLTDWNIELAPLENPIAEIIQFNDLMNLNLLIKRKKTEALRSSEVEGALPELSLFTPCKNTEEELEEYLDKPDEAPPFVEEFLNKYKESEERLKNFEKVYLDYFQSLEGSSSIFVRTYANFEFTLRTIVSAFRARRDDLNLEWILTGKDEIVELILENRSAADFGLKNYFPQVTQVVECFEKSPSVRDKGLDYIRFEFLSDVGPADPFEEDWVLAYFLRLLILERWHKLDEQKGTEKITQIATGEMKP